MTFSVLHPLCKTAERQKFGKMAFLLKRIIHNDAMKQDPHEIYGWRVYALACAACFGGMLFGFDTGAIGGVLKMPVFKEYVSCISPRVSANVNLV